MDSEEYSSALKPNVNGQTDTRRRVITIAHIVSLLFSGELKCCKTQVGEKISTAKVTPEGGNNDQGWQ